MLFGLAVKVISLVLSVLLLINSDVPIVMSLGMQTLLLELSLIINGIALFCAVACYEHGGAF